MRVCAAPGCHVQMFGDDEFCQHHEGMKLFDEQYGTNTFPEEKMERPYDQEPSILARVKRQAQKEIEEEEFAEAVERYKAKLRQQKWWHKFVPFKVLIVRRETDG